MEVPGTPGAAKALYAAIRSSSSGWPPAWSSAMRPSVASQSTWLGLGPGLGLGL